MKEPRPWQHMERWTPAQAKTLTILYDIRKQNDRKCSRYQVELKYLQKQIARCKQIKATNDQQITALLAMRRSAHRGLKPGQRTSNKFRPTKKKGVSKPKLKRDPANKSKYAELLEKANRQFDRMLKKEKRTLQRSNYNNPLWVEQRRKAAREKRFQYNMEHMEL